MADDIHPQPPWLVEVAIEPKSAADREKLGVALAKLAAEDPSFRVSTDRESGQTILKGIGELHLASKIDILRRTYKVDANVGALQVAFYERITQRVEVEYTETRRLSARKVTSRALKSSSSPTSQARATRSSLRSATAR
jgi:translation elongation factor EF-G